MPSSTGTSGSVSGMGGAATGSTATSGQASVGHTSPGAPGGVNAMGWVWDPQYGAYLPPVSSSFGQQAVRQAAIQRVLAARAAGQPVATAGGPGLPTGLGGASQGAGAGFTGAASVNPNLLNAINSLGGGQAPAAQGGGSSPAASPLPSTGTPPFFTLADLRGLDTTDPSVRNALSALYYGNAPAPTPGPSSLMSSLFQTLNALGQDPGGQFQQRQMAMHPGWQ